MCISPFVEGELRMTYLQENVQREIGKIRSSGSHSEPGEWHTNVNFIRLLWPGEEKSEEMVRETAYVLWSLGRTQRMKGQQEE